MTIKLKKGKALLIHGAQGSGKTTLAIETAKKYGDFKIIEFDQLVKHYDHGSTLENETDTLIIDEFVATKDNLVFMKHIITDPAIKPPNFILCASNRASLRILRNSRRFTVVEI